MSTDKMTPTPWVAGGSFPYKGNEGYIFAVTNRPEVLVCKTFGTIDENTPSIAEQMENSKAIVTAINNTYGKGINPEAVQDLYDALKRMIDMGGYCPHGADSLEEGFPERFERAKSAIEKATIK